MGTQCPSPYTEEEKRLLDEAENATFDLPAGTIEKEMPAAEITKLEEDYHRAVEETGRQEMAEARVLRDEQDLKYQELLRSTGELQIGVNHQVLIKGFDASRIDSKDTARIQALFPAIVSQATQGMEFTGKLPPLEMDASGKVWATVENWDQVEGGATGVFHRHTAEMEFEKSEEELTPEEKNFLAQQQMDTQLHWNFHTIYEILLTEDERVEVERICIEHSQSKPGWERDIGPYAARMAREGRIDEVFCEFGKQFMADFRTSPLKPTDLEGLNPELYSFIKTRLRELSERSENEGLTLKIGE